MTQTELREKVIFAIYDMLLGGDSHQEKDPKTTICGIFEADYEEIPLYCRELFIKSLINKEEIIKKIEPNLNRWTFNRLNYVIQAMLVYLSKLTALGISEIQMTKKRIRLHSQLTSLTSA